MLSFNLSLPPLTPSLDPVITMFPCVVLRVDGLLAEPYLPAIVRAKTPALSSWWIGNAQDLRGSPAWEIIVRIGLPKGWTATWAAAPVTWALPLGQSKENLSPALPPEYLSLPPGPGRAHKGRFFPDHTPGVSSIAPLCDPVPEIWWRNSRETNGDYMEINHAQLMFSAGNCSILFPFHFSPVVLKSLYVLEFYGEQMLSKITFVVTFLKYMLSFCLSNSIFLLLW